MMDEKKPNVPDTPLNVAIVMLLHEWSKQEKEFHHHIGKLRSLMNNLAATFMAEVVKDENAIAAMEDAERAAAEASKSRIITLD